MSLICCPREARAVRALSTKVRIPARMPVNNLAEQAALPVAVHQSQSVERAGQVGQAWSAVEPAGAHRMPHVEHQSPFAISRLVHASSALAQQTVPSLRVQSAMGQR